MEPSARLRLGSCDVLLLGTVPGFVPDAARVEAAAATLAPEAIVLGVPAEDLTSLDALAASAATGGEAPELVEPDALTERFLQTLSSYGPTAIPSPDLKAAHAAAKAMGIPLVAVDLDDEAHAELYTGRVRFHHVLRSNSRYKRLLKRGLRERAPDAYAFARAWDDATLATGSLRAVESAREEAMAKGLAAAAVGRQRLLAVLPAPRHPGVVALLKARAAGPAAAAAAQSL